MAHILVIDDDSDILRLMQFALERAGFQVGLAVDGPQGLDMIKKHPPDLIIADVMMPEMTGYELTRRVRKMPNMEKLPIIIYSARFQPVDKQAALEAGATDYLPKTVSPTEIVKQVKQHLRQANVPTPATGLLAKSLTTAFFSLRGGVGVTSLAVNVAVALALSRKTPVGLTDLNPIAGHAGLMLNLHPKSHIYNILNSEKPISNAIVNQHFTPHASGVQLLASPLIAPEGATKHQAGQMLQHIRALLQYNIIDLPHTLTSATAKILTEIDKLVLVLSPDVPSLQSAAVALQLLPQRGLHLEQIVIVLNRNTPEAGLNVGAIQKTLRQPLTAEIPYEANMLTAINSRKPLVLHSPQSPATTAIAKLAVSLLK